MPHNGNIGQINLHRPNGENAEFPFINLYKLAGAVTGVGSSIIEPDRYSADGYPLSSTGTDGAFRRVYFPHPDKRSGNYKIRWLGRCALALNQYTTVSGSPGSVATDGECVITPTGDEEGLTYLKYVDVGFASIDDGNPPRHLEIFHTEDETDYDAGEIFNPVFLERVSKFGTIRFLNTRESNSSQVTHWLHERPESFASYGSPYCPPGGYKGTTTNTGDAYAITIPGFVVEDKAWMVIKFNATSSGTSPTLSVNGGAAIPILDSGGLLLDSTIKPQSGSFSPLVYDADLNVWCKSMNAFGDAAGFRPGWPIGIALRLCKEAGAHPWFLSPHLTLDPLTDHLTEMATACKEYAETEATWMVPRFEPPNEIFNTIFTQTTYFWGKGAAQWGGSANFSQEDDYYGRIGSIMGAELASVYGGTAAATGKYEFICGAQQPNIGATLDATRFDKRRSGKHVSVDAGTPASTYYTRMAPAMYGRLGADVQDALDAAYDLGYITDPTERIAFADAFVRSTPHATGTGLGELFVQWKEYCEARNLVYTTYEGALGFDYPTLDTRDTITAVTKGATTVATVSAGTVFPPVGEVFSVFGTVGMTQLNSFAVTFSGGGSANINGGNVMTVGRRVRFTNSGGALPTGVALATTYYVVSAGNPFQVSATEGGVAITFAGAGTGTHGCAPLYEVISYNTGAKTVTFDVDSTSFSDWVSDGTLNYTDTRVLRTALTETMKLCDAFGVVAAGIQTQFRLYGGVEPSAYRTCGNDAWGKCFPTIYDPTPEFDALAEWSTAPNTGAKVMKLSLTAS
jgi:hypothetical protein